MPTVHGEKAVMRVLDKSSMSVTLEQIGFLPDEDVGMVVLWNSESAAPSGLMPSLMDRVLGLPTQDWLGVDTDESRD